ncbi:MAG: hypothetical protein SNJ53_07900, partial [Thermodesulfovibrionales bacterium]
SLILFIGDDITPDHNFLIEHLNTHNNLNHSGKTAVLGYTAWPKSFRVTPFLEFINGYGHQFGYELIKNGEILDFTLFYTSNISLSKNFLTGMSHVFDEDFNVYGWEDIELGYRLQQKGMHIIYNSKAKAEHYHKMNTFSFCKRQVNVGMGAHTIFSKHPELYRLLNTHRVSTWVRHKHFASILRFFIFLCDMLNIRLPHLIYRYVLNVYYSIGYMSKL